MTGKNSGKTDVELRRYLRNAAIGGGSAALVALVVTTLVGLGSGEDKRILLEAMLPSVRFLCSSVMTATATILSLMLALLGFSSNTDQDLDGGFYGQVKAISLVDTIVFIGATVLLLSISIPLNKSDDLPPVVV